MVSNILDRISFWSLFIVIVLLPIFFLPFTRIAVETSKGLLVVVGLVLSIIFWSAARFSDGRISIAKSWCLISGFGIVLVVLLSAIFSSSPEVSFFGVMFDVGSFWFIFAAFLMMLMSSILIKDSVRAKMVLFGILLFSAISLVFQAFHLFFPQYLSLGVLGDKTTNLLGSWSALGIFSGFFSVMSLFIIEFFPVSRGLKQILGFLTVLALLLVAAANFSLIWALVGIFSLVIFVYKISLSSVKRQNGESPNFPVTSFAIMMISLLFLMSSQFIGGFLSNELKISNLEVRPSFSATMSITGQTLKQNPILGIGPNRFGEAWAMYKPSVINNTVFWEASFDSGSGLIPTFAATTGYLGIISWLLFFALFIVAGMRSLFSSVKNNLNWETVTFFVGALYFFAASFFYPVGLTMFVLALVFTGIFIGLSYSSREDEVLSLSFSDDHRKNFFSVFVLLLLMVASSALGFKYIERFASVAYFGQALSSAAIPDAEASISKAISLHPSDLYLRTYAQVYLLKMNTLANKGSALTEAEKIQLQESLTSALASAMAAKDYNPKSYQNFRLLGAVYDAAGALGATGAYEQAVLAYKQASTLDPLNPGLKLSIARSYYANGNMKDAKDFAEQSLTLKSDYVNALITLSQIAKKTGNNSDALQFAEKALSYAPEDKDLIQYVNSLKNSNFSGSADTSSSPIKQDKKTQ